MCWEIDFVFFNIFEDGKLRIFFYLKVGVEGGVSWKERFFFFIGFIYMFCFDEGYFSCDFCDMVFFEFIISLYYKFLEIFIGFNVLFIKDRFVDFFIGVSIFYILFVGDYFYRFWVW